MMSPSTAEGSSDIEMSSLAGGVNPSSSQGRVSEDNSSRSADGLESDDESLTALKSSGVFWYKFLRRPLLFLAINVIMVISIIMAFNFWNESPDDRTLIMQTSMICFLLASIAAADAVVLYKASIHVDKELEELARDSTEQGDNNENPQQTFWATPVQVHAKVSKRIDSFLTQRRSIPKVSFLICFLLALFGIAVSVSVFLVAGGIQFQFFHQNDKCFSSNYDTMPEEEEPPLVSSVVLVPKKSKIDRQPVRRLQKEVQLDPSENEEQQDIMGVPKNLQQWARYGHGPMDSSNYVHLSNGETVLVGQDSKMLEPHIVILHANGTIESHEDKLNPSPFVKVGRNNLSSETVGFCCEFYPDEDHYRPPVTSHILCYYDGKIQNFEWDPSSKTVRARYSMDHVEMKNNEDNTMWLRQQSMVASGRSRHGTIETYIAKVDLLTMELTQVTKFDSGTDTDTNGDWGANKGDPKESCYDQVTLTASIASLFAAAGLSYWLLMLREIPSGLVPICCIVLMTLDNDVDVAEVCICLVCLFAWLVAIRLTFFKRPQLNEFGQEALLWTVYSSLATCTVVAMMTDASDGIFVVLLLTIVFIGLLLDHPVLTVVGGIGAVALVVLVIAGLFTGELEILFEVVPLVALMSSGLCSLGVYCTKYRPYLVAYSKLLFRYVMTRIHYHSSAIVGGTLNPPRDS